jgi:Smg protein
VENLDNKALDIIIYLAQYIKSNQGKLGNLVEVFRDLQELGFSEDEIRKASHWFLNRLPGIYKSEKGKSSLYSHLSGLNQNYFTPESFGFLYQIEELGLLNQNEMEILIQRSLALGEDKVELQTIKNLANILFFSGDDLNKLTNQFLWMEQENI